MRHLKRGRKLGRTSSHRKAMLRNMATSLFVHGRIVTTPTKAKEARPYAEKLITLAKNGSLAARRRALAELHDARVVASLFSELGPRYKERPGGYTRILHLAKRRVGDGAPQVLFELVEAEIRRKTRGDDASTTDSAKPAEETEAKAADTTEATEGTEASAEEAPAETTENTADESKSE